MHPLPTELPKRLHTHPEYSDISSAYDICLCLQTKIQEENDSGKDTKIKMIYCRIVGYLLHYPPTDHALKTVVYEVVSAKSDESLLKIGEMYLNHFIRPFRCNQGRTPASSVHTSRRGLDKIADMKLSMLKVAPQDHQTAKKNALVRDGFRCVVTKVYDSHIAMANEELRGIVECGRMPPVPTHCAHIFPESTNVDITPGSNKEKYATSVWAVLHRFGYTGIFEELNGSKIHRLENVMTLEGYLHDPFDRLEIWLTATDERDRYKLEAAHSMFLINRPEFVTFSTPDPQRLPLPNPAYLHIHATCAKVAHLSGASEYLEKVSRDLEDICVLAEDGSSSQLLHEAILSSAMHLIYV